MGWRFHVERVDYTRALSAALLHVSPSGVELAARPLEMVAVDPGAALADNQILLQKSDTSVRAILQAIVDGCWEAGIRPTGVEDFRRANDAQGAHLRDMRAIVGKQLDVDLK